MVNYQNTMHGAKSTANRHTSMYIHVVRFVCWRVVWYCPSNLVTFARFGVAEYYRSVEEGRARLEQRKAVIKSQEKQLNDAFEVVCYIPGTRGKQPLF